MEGWKAICCAIAELINQGFGDPTDSKGGLTTIGTDYILLFNSSRPSIVSLKVTGAVNIEINCTGTGTGQVIEAGESLVLDRFKGAMYARAASGTSIVSWYVWLANVNII